MPAGTTQEQLKALLTQRFEVAKKLYFPTWDNSWWDLHIPNSTEKGQIVEWYTHMPKEYLLS